jgi:hypothetical protein
MRKHKLFLYLFFLGTVLFTSCSPEVDNYPSVSGKTDPTSIEKANLVGYFPFESKAYSTIKSYGIDSSTVAFGARDSFALGQRGYCFQGDTTKSYIQYKLSSNNTIQRLNEFTIASWIKVPSKTDSRTAPIFIINGGDTISGAGSLSVSLDPLFLKAYMFSDSAKINAHEIKVDRNLIKSGEWIHIAITYNSTTSTLALYANGNQLKEDTCYANADTIPKLKTGKLKMAKLKMTKLTIGAWPQQILGTATSSMTFFTGSIDEMRIWNKGLSKETINTLYKAEASQARNK